MSEHSEKSNWPMFAAVAMLVVGLWCAASFSSPTATTSSTTLQTISPMGNEIRIQYGEKGAHVYVNGEDVLDDDGHWCDPNPLHSAVKRR